MQIILFVLSLLSYYAIHSVLADNKVKNFLITKLVNKKYYRLLFNFSAIILLIPIFYLYARIDATFLFHNTVLSTVGLVAGIFGLVLLMVALSQYNLAEFSGIEQLLNESSPSPTSLNTTGLNGIVRHPLYFAGLIIIWGGFMYKPSDTVLVLAIVSTLYLYIGSKLEEQKLVLEFGEAYKAYQQEVGMLLPFLK